MDVVAMRGSHQKMIRQAILLLEEAACLKRDLQTVCDHEDNPSPDRLSSFFECRFCDKIILTKDFWGQKSKPRV